MWAWVTEFLRDGQEGQGIVEYSLILAFVVIVGFLGVTAVGNGLGGLITGEISALGSHMGT